MFWIKINTTVNFNYQCSSNQINKTSILKSYLKEIHMISSNSLNYMNLYMCRIQTNVAFLQIKQNNTMHAFNSNVSL